MGTNLGVIDLDTGEVLEGKYAHVPPKHRLNFDMWVAVNNDAWKVLIERRFDGNTLRVWMALLMNCDWQNKVEASQREMAEQIGMDSANFNRYLNKLVEAGLVVKTCKEGRRQKLSISIDYVWRGKAKEHTKAVNDRFKMQRLEAQAA